MLRKLVLIICLAVITLQIVFIIFFKQGLLTQKYDSAYWRDRYEHSQYVLPKSQRIIGDDALFAYAGYRVIQGDDPTLINVDKPPLGKYLIGISLLLFKSIAPYALLFGFLTLVSFFYLTLLVVKDKLVALLTTTILFVDPLFVNQLWNAWIDIPQLFFFVTNLLFLFSYKKSWVFLLLSGICLGLFAETKPPILLPIILIVELVFLFAHNKKSSLSSSFWLLVSLAIGALIPYLPFLFMDHSLLDVARYHKFMTVFYLSSKVEANYFAIWQVLFIGQFPDLLTGIASHVSEWWIGWPIVCILTLFSLFYPSKKILLYEKVIGILVVGIMLIFSFIPAYARYLLLVIPFIYLAFANRLILLKKIPLNLPIIILTVIMLAGFVASYKFLQPRPSEIFERFKYSYSHMYMKDIYYEIISNQSKKDMTIDTFNKINLEALNQAQIESVDINEISRVRYKDKIQVKVQITYKTTSLGTFMEEKNLEFIKENSEWKMTWNWNTLLQDFVPGDKLISSITAGRRGSIISKKKGILAQDKESFLVAIEPEKIDLKKESQMLKTLEWYLEVGSFSIQTKYNENPLPGQMVTIATIWREYTPRELVNLKSIDGIVLIPRIARLYPNSESPKDLENRSFESCCSRIYSSTNFHGVSGNEKKYEDVLVGNDGGTLKLIDKNGIVKRVILEKKAANGEDVYIN